MNAQLFPGIGLQDGTLLQQLMNSITLGASVSYGGSNRSPQAAVNGTTPGMIVALAPGNYNEALVIPRGAGPLTIIGNGPRGSVAIAPTASNATGITNSSDDITFINVGGAGVGTGSGLINNGSRLRAFGCKFENDDGTGFAAQLQVGSVAAKAAGTAGSGADILMDDCEFCWAAIGIKLLGSDYGAVTQAMITNSRFHNLATASFEEGFSAGGAATLQYRNLTIRNNIFDADEAGVQPTKYLSLNDSNSNTGVASGNQFPVAINSGKNLVSTLLIWTGNFMTGGISAAQPS